MVLLLPLYLLAMVPTEQINVDAEPAALPAWQLAQHGTVDLTGVDAGNNPFVRPTEAGRVMSNRAIGITLLATPAYLITDDDTFSPDPSTVTAALIAVAAMAVLLQVLRRVLPLPWAFGSTLVVALGTATWPISAGQLWPHGPGQLAAAGLLLGMASASPLAAGLSGALGVLVRPVAAIIPATVALLAAWRRRWAEAALLVLPAVAALVAIVLYNRWAFGEPSLSGGYEPRFRENLRGQTPWGYVKNVAAMLASPKNGLLVWSPIVAVALLGLRRAWPETPRWAKDGALAGAAYLLLHLRLNRASGGLPIDYRYPLEALVLAAPALALAARSFLAGAEWRRRALFVGVVASVLLQGTVALTYECDEIIDDELAECRVL